MKDIYSKSNTGLICCPLLCKWVGGEERRKKLLCLLFRPFLLRFATTATAKSQWKEEEEEEIKWPLIRMNCTTSWWGNRRLNRTFRPSPSKSRITQRPFIRRGSRKDWRHTNCSTCIRVPPPPLIKRTQRRHKEPKRVQLLGLVPCRFDNNSSSK